MQKSDGGSRSQRMGAQWPALAGQKISQTVFTLEPCAMRPAHVHPRASGLLYVVSGGRRTVVLCGALYMRSLAHAEAKLAC